MDFGGTVLEEVLRRLPKLRPADDGIIDEEETFALDQFSLRNQFHPGNQIAPVLMGRHKAPGPGGRVFHKGPLIGYSGFIGVADGMGYARIGNACHAVRTDPPDHIPLCKGLAAGITGILHIQPLIFGSGKAVINPQKRTYLSVIQRLLQDFYPVRRQKNDFTRAKLMLRFVPQIQK